MNNQQNFLWGLEKKNWIKFENIEETQDYFLQSITNQENEKTKNNKQLKEIYQMNKKIDNPSKGSICYINEGYGIIQNVKPGGIYEIKLKNTEKVVLCKKNEIKFEMPLKISVLLNNIIINSSIVVNLNCKVSEVISKINESLDKGGECQSIIYNGKELAKYQDQEISILGINQNSKFLAVNPATKLLKLSRYAKFKSDNWYYSNKSTDGVTFSASKEMKIAGMGIFTTNTETNFEIKFVQGRDANGEILASKSIMNSRSSGNIQECIFDKFIKISADQEYSFVQIAMASTTGYYGEEAPTNQETENGITLTFKSCQNADNGTEANRGQIAEIYYYA